LLDNPSTIAVLGNNLVQNVPNGGVLKTERPHAECQIAAGRVTHDSAAFRIQDKMQVDAKGEAGFVHARLCNAELWYPSA
jgi:hypothetical protein